MTGALLHAQTVSQILSVVLDKRPLIWFWSEEVEMLWIVSWGLASSILIGRTRHPLLLIVSVGTILGFLIGTSFWLFIQDVWVPVAAPALALVITSAAVVASRLRQPPLQSTAISSETPANPTTNRQVTVATVLEDRLPSEIVSFESTSRQITMRGSLEPNQRQPYSLSCSQGQMLTIQATEGNISITVVAPGRQAVGMVTGTNARWQGLLPTSGNYIIEVSTVVASKYVVSFNLTNQNSSVSEIITTVIPSQASDSSSSTETHETKINPENVTKKYEM